MKTTYFLFSALLFAGYHSDAQLTLTKAAHEPIVGDVRHQASLDSSSAIPKNTGTGQVWDFSTMANPGFTETITYTTVASSPGGSLNPSATLAGRRGTDNYEFYKTSTSTFEFTGYTDVNDNRNLVLSDMVVFGLWPTSYGTSGTDVASGVETSPGSTVTLNATVSINGAGTGTVIMPNGSSHNNCLQVIRSLTIAMTSGTMTGLVLQKTYIYYSSTKKQPVAEIEYANETVNSVTTKDYTAYFDVSGVSVGLLQYSPAGPLRIYPVPASEELSVKLGDKAPDGIDVLNMEGKLIMSVSDTGKLDVSGLDNGFYLLKIRSGDRTRSKIVSVQH